ncbi:MAG: shikimate kinase [Cryomorphaceae bacterium BACL22 MAG-120619-bin32]|jgi:shikimate kinase|nr:MAG: shikimate kinase [Cryomorphaceae bacterium BACL22 MAG-120619-bin32]
MHIILLGYMASGKSTIGKQLSKKLGIPFLDLDTYIYEKENKSVSEIFLQNGEIYFRKKEHEYLREVLENQQDFILSLGGGTPCYANNIELILNKNSISIYLKASIQTLSNRLLKNKNLRPLVAFLEDDQVPEFIAKHLFERRFFYEQARKVVVIDQKSVSEIVDEIGTLL